MRILYAAVVLAVAFAAAVYVDVSYTGLFYADLSGINPEWEVVSKIEVRKNEISVLGA